MKRKEGEREKEKERQREYECIIKFLKDIKYHSYERVIDMKLYHIKLYHIKLNVNLKINHVNYILTHLY